MDNFDTIWQNMIKSLRFFLHNSKNLRTFAPVFGYILPNAGGIGGIGRRARLRIWFRKE